MILRWDISLGFYPGMLVGFRSYPNTGNGVENHVIYMPFVDICLTIERDVDEKE